jgi:integrase/recombinase XerC/integrase/recombinase XerD
LQERVAPKTVYEAQLALRRFFRFLLREGETSVDPTLPVKLTRYRVDPQPTYTPAEVKRLLLACNTSSPNGLRDRALVMTLFDTGVREGELVSMSVPDWDKRLVRVVGKTGIRDVPLGTVALQAVERYMRRWGVVDGSLWRGKKGPLTGSGVLQAVRRLCKRAGVEDKGVHAFRRAAAAQMKRLGMNDSDILEVMGWKSITMLRRYIAAVAGELAHEAHDKYSPGDAIGLR